MLKPVFLCFALCLPVLLPAAAQGRSTPEAAVRTFLAAYERGDLKQAADCVQGAQLSEGALEALAREVRKEPVAFTLAGVKTATDGIRATVTGQLAVKPAKAPKAQTVSTEVRLVSSDGTWRIVPNAAAAGRDKNPDIVNALAYVLTDPKVLTRAHDAAAGAACLSNVKQLCTAAFVFARNHEERLALKAATYPKSLKPYVRRSDVFHCPSEPGSSTSYSFNDNLAGLALPKIAKLAETVLFYEGRGGKLEFRHEGRAAVGFADGHAKLVNAEGAKALRWKP